MSDPIEEIPEPSNSKKSDFMSMGGSMLSCLNIKVAVGLFIIGMLLFSDLFIDGVLSKFDDMVHGECATTKGTIVQLIVLVLLYLVIDLLVQAGWL